MEGALWWKTGSSLFRPVFPLGLTCPLFRRFRGSVTCMAFNVLDLALTRGATITKTLFEAKARWSIRFSALKSRVRSLSIARLKFTNSRVDGLLPYLNLHTLHQAVRVLTNNMCFFLLLLFWSSMLDIKAQAHANQLQFPPTFIACLRQTKRKSQNLTLVSLVCETWQLHLH